jgi:hypothetical protein
VLIFSADQCLDRTAHKPFSEKRLRTMLCRAAWSAGAEDSGGFS